MYRKILNADGKISLIKLKVYFMTLIYFSETFTMMLKNADFKKTGYYSWLTEFI